MSPTWVSGEPPTQARITPGGWLRVAIKGSLIGVVTFGGLGLLLLGRLIEWPLFGARRPVTPFITQFVCKFDLMVIGIWCSQAGRPMRGFGALVANHSSWLDIFALNARDRFYFVAKAEVSTWPAVGWLARATCTMFIERRGGAADDQRQEILGRLKNRHRLLFFPEGTSTDGLRVLDFKSAPLAAFFDVEIGQDLCVQPISVRYTAPEAADPRFYGFWGQTYLVPHLIQVLAAPRQGSVEVMFHDPLRVADFADRKALATALGRATREGFDTGQVIAAR